MSRNRIAAVVALVVAALVVSALAIFAVRAYGGPPDCSQVQEDAIDDSIYKRLRDVSRFTEALAVVRQVHETHTSLRTAPHLAEDFKQLPGLQEVLAHQRKAAANQPPKKESEDSPAKRRGKSAGVLGSTYVGLQGYSGKLDKAVRSKERTRIAKEAKRGADLLGSVVHLLAQFGRVSPKLVADTQQQLNTDVESLRAVQYACGHCGSPQADRIPVPADDWADYRCAERAEREDCFPRAKYSNTRGLGCPGQGAEAQLCCPPAGACSLSPSRRPAGAWVLVAAVVLVAAGACRRAGRSTRRNSRPDSPRP